MSWPVTAMLLATTSSAEPPILDLEWEAPSECPDASEARRRTQEMLRAAGAGDGGDGFRARGTMRAEGEGYSLELVIEGPHGAGVRHLRDVDCESLTDAAALVMTFAIDPASALTWEIPEPPPDQGRAVAPAAPNATSERSTVLDRAAPPDAEDQPVRARRGGADAARDGDLAFTLRGGLGGDALTWRPFGLSLGLATGVVGRGYRVELVGRYAAPSTITSPTDAALRARVQQWSVGVNACGVPALGRDRRLELPLCLGIEAGAMHARGIGAAVVARSSHAPWLAMTAGPTLLWRFAPRLAAWIGVEAVVLVGRARFVTDRGTEVLHPRRAGLRALAGVEVRLRGREP